jgi:malic enzyme
MKSYNKQPIIFALSPASKLEVTPAEAYAFTDNSCLYCSIAESPPVTTSTNELKFSSFVEAPLLYPGLLLGAASVKCNTISLNMLLAAVNELSNSTSEEEKRSGLLLPAKLQLRKVAKNIAISVAYASSSSSITSSTSLESGSQIIDEAKQKKLKKYTDLIEMSIYKADYKHVELLNPGMPTTTVNEIKEQQ